MTGTDFDRMRRTRALNRIARNNGEAKKYGQRFSAERERELLAWAATIPDEDILDWRNTGPGILRWIREHQQADTLRLVSLAQGEAGSADYGETPVRKATVGATFSAVIKSTGWRVELFWNGGGGWFTARLVSLYDRDGNRTYSGGFLVPFDDPIGAGGATPEEAIANLGEAVLEWA